MSTGNDETASGAPGPPPKRRPWWRRHWKLLSVGFVFLIIGLAVGAGGESGSTTTDTVTREEPTNAPEQTNTTPTTPTTQTETTPAPETGATCTKPCADSNGWIVEVKAFKYDVPSGNEFITPESGNVFVTIDVEFINHSSSSRSAAAYDFKLASGGVERDAEILSPCESWSSVDVAPGASYGPKCLGFEVASGNRTGTLKWRPGLIRTYEIPVS